MAISDNNLNNQRNSDKIMQYPTYHGFTNNFT